MNSIHHEIQKNGVELCRKVFPICDLLLKAIPNGGARSKAEAGRMKAEGVVAGAWDLELAVAYLDERNWDSDVIGKDHWCHYPDERYWEIVPGLIIEVKRPDQRNHKNGGLTDAQVSYCEAMSEQGWECAVCYSAQDIFDAVQEHLKKAM